MTTLPQREALLRKERFLANLGKGPSAEEIVAYEVEQRMLEERDERNARAGVHISRAKWWGAK